MFVTCPPPGVRRESRTSLPGATARQPSCAAIAPGKVATASSPQARRRSAAGGKDIDQKIRPAAPRTSRIRMFVNSMSDSKEEPLVTDPSVMVREVAESLQMRSV